MELTEQARRAVLTKLARLEKTAVSLAQLRVANRAMKGSVIRPSKGAARRLNNDMFGSSGGIPVVAGGMPSRRAARRAAVAAQAKPLPAWSWRRPITSFRNRKFVKRRNSDLLEQQAHTADLAGVIPRNFERRVLMRGDPGRLVGPEGRLNAGLRSSAEREALARTIRLHEGAEATGKVHGRGLPFASHNSTRPALQDLNIAATLKGPGQGASTAIRRMREGEVAALERAIPGLERLNLGNQRISRHAQKRIQEAYERSMLRDPGFYSLAGNAYQFYPRRRVKGLPRVKALF